MAYEVSTPVFEGPFDLLLHLISKEQVNLYEISLATIVDAFLVEIEKMKTLDLDVATEFLMIAATLVELKLRRLLPERANVEMDEELALLEERDLLLAKLLEYQTFRHAAMAMRNMENRAMRSFPRTNVIEENFATLTPDLLASVTPLQLRTAFLRSITRALIPKVEPKVTLDHVTDVRLTVAEAVNEMALELPRLGRATFRTLTESATETIEVVVRFLAVLELFKQGWIEVDQLTNFGDMVLIWRPDGPGELEASLVRPMRADGSFDESGPAPIGDGGLDDAPSPTFASMRQLVDGEIDTDELDAEDEIDAALARVQAERRAAATGASTPDQAGTVVVDENVDDAEVKHVEAARVAVAQGEVESSGAATDQAPVFVPPVITVDEYDG